MVLEGTWPVVYQGETVGHCRVEKRGLYAHFYCQAGPERGLILRLILESEEGTLPLGIPLPQAGELVLTKKIPAKRLPDGQTYRIELVSAYEEAAPMPEQAGKPEANPEPEAEPEQKVESEPEPTETVPEPQPAQEAESEAVQEAEKEPEPQTVQETEPEAVQEAEPEPETNPEPIPEAESESVPAPEAAPEPEQVQPPESVPESRPEPKPEPDWNPKPQPVSGIPYSPNMPIPGLENLEQLRAAADENGVIRLYSAPREE